MHNQVIQAAPALPACWHLPDFLLFVCFTPKQKKVNKTGFYWSPFFKKRCTSSSYINSVVL